jgi:glycosyltransferase involved in cell wall biosynthesis
MKVISQYNDWNQSDERSKVNGYGGCGYYRIVQPSKLLGFDIKGKEQAQQTNDAYYNDIFSLCDVYWLHHICNPQVIKSMVVQAMVHKKKIIVDLDDDFFSIPQNHTAYDVYKHRGHGRLGLSTLLTFVDAITVSNEHLKMVISAYLKLVHKMEKPIFVIENRVNPTMWREETKKRRVIGYSGSTSHIHDLNLVLPAIKKVMEKDKEVRFEMLGVLSKENARKAFKGWDNSLLERIAMLGATATYEEYPDMLAEKGWKVAIAPLVKNDFNKARSNIKWQEYTMSGYVTIATDFTPYDGTNAIKCNTDEDWVREIEKWLDEDATEYLKEARHIIDTKYKHDKKTLEEIFKPILASL